VTDNPSGTRWQIAYLIGRGEAVNPEDGEPVVLLRNSQDSVWDLYEGVETPAF